MAIPLARIFDDARADVGGKIVGLFALLVVANVAVWLWAFATFGNRPALMATAFLAYTLGLRHAVDADHIAAIDNVTRKLMQDGKRPVAVGFFFSLGHSTIVVLASVAIAATATAFKGRMETFHDIGGMIGTLVSATFLIVIAIVNIFVLVAAYRAFESARSGAVQSDADIDVVLARGGVLARLYRPMFKLMTRSWQMYPLGFLFGLGFDTATEIGLLGISAAGASQGMSIWSILIFPALFTAGMSLIDTTDSVLMLGAYGWAFVKPIRKLYYNMTITAVSVVVALVIGSLEALNLLAAKLQPKGALWETIGAVNDNLGLVGFLIIAIFVGAWLLSFLIYRAKGYDALDAAETSSATG